MSDDPELDKLLIQHQFNFYISGAFPCDKPKISRSDLIKSADIHGPITPNEGSSILPQYEKYTINVSKQANQPLGKWVLTRKSEID